ncbi:hypothetical protein Hypma_011059 [Hypsizygus marmoreus]|uniref:C2H2-type domain-containing protein n=1 Tax=Hypsizygus marmoreus TaxID=39966 RepID=A0A369JSP7_HYPMA|nr:hypothetical protein Hypma_011059 [Hypsizygus marmoreus]
MMSDGADILAALFYGTLRNAAHSPVLNTADPHALPIWDTVNPAELQISSYLTKEQDALVPGAPNEIQDVQYDSQMAQVPSFEPWFTAHPPPVPRSFTQSAIPVWNGFGGQTVDPAYPFDFQIPVTIPDMPPQLGGYAFPMRTLSPPILPPQNLPTNAGVPSSGTHFTPPPPLARFDGALYSGVGPCGRHDVPSAPLPDVAEPPITCPKPGPVKSSSCLGKRPSDVLAELASKYPDLASSIRVIHIDSKRTFTCTICHESVEGSTASIRRHLRLDHCLKINARRQCIHPNCTIIVKVDSMPRHVLTHVQPERMECGLCGLGFSRSDRVLLHLKNQACTVLKKADGNTEIDQSPRKRVRTVPN